MGKINKEQESRKRTKQKILEKTKYQKNEEQWEIRIHKLSKFQSFFCILINLVTEKLVGITVSGKIHEQSDSLK